MPTRLAHVLPLLSFALMARSTEASAQACGSSILEAPFALPMTGAVGVAQRSSIFVMTPSAELPQGLALTANGEPVPLPFIQSLGFGEFGVGVNASFWQLRTQLLLPSATYVLSVVEEGTSKELTRFSTADKYDKPVGHAPVLTGLRLWRIRYPVHQVRSGRCVSSEYEGYIDLDYRDGSVPGTPAEELIGVVNLHPRLGGPSQFFAFGGGTHFEGAPLWNSATQALVDVPEGGLPSPTHAVWKPALEPDREYCVSMTLYGRNQSGVPLKGDAVCAKVVSVDARSTGHSSGCQVSGERTDGVTMVMALLGVTLVLRRAKRSYGAGPDGGSGRAPVMVKRKPA
jgi:hypothetical protein